MDPQIAKNIIALLQRTQLSGHEVPIYMQAVNELNKLANPLPADHPGYESSPA